MNSPTILNEVDVLVFRTSSKFSTASLFITTWRFFVHEPSFNSMNTIVSFKPVLFNTKYEYIYIRFLLRLPNCFSPS